MWTKEFIMSNKVNFDEYTENYNSILRDSTGFFSSSEEYFAEYKIRLVKANNTGEVKRVLEYGCGIGRNIPYIQTSFPAAEVYGTDITEGTLEYARSQNINSNFFLESDDLELGLFDLIFVAGVFHHIPPAERSRSMSTLAKRLSKHGNLFVFEHNPYNPVTRRIVNNCVYDADAVLVKPKEMRRLIEYVGMAVSAQEYCLFVPPSMSVLLPIESLFKYLPLGGQYWTKAVHV